MLCKWIIKNLNYQESEFYFICYVYIMFIFTFFLQNQLFTIPKALVTIYGDVIYLKQAMVLLHIVMKY